MKGLWLAADFSSVAKTIRLLDQIGDDFFGVKTHIFTVPAARERIKVLREWGVKHFWQDFKGHDIPKTVASLAEQYQRCGVDYVTVHASGGLRMMRETVSVGVKVYAVLILTSLSEAQEARYYNAKATANMIEDAMSAGVAGFICPPTRVAGLKSHLGHFNGVFDIVVPGTRFLGAETHDQQRVETPGIAVADGADYLVIGSMVTEAENPRVVMERLRREIKIATAAKAAQA